MPDIVYMDAAEFRDQGFLQEINRLLLHPCGLALQLDTESGEAKIWDYRDDPEGMIFAEGVLSAAKAENVCEVLLAKRGSRQKEVGYVVQSAGSTKRTLTVNYLDPETPAAPVAGGYEFEA